MSPRSPVHTIGWGLRILTLLAFVAVAGPGRTPMSAEASFPHLPAPAAGPGWEWQNPPSVSSRAILYQGESPNPYQP